MCWVRQRDLGTEHMALFVNSNLALELPADLDRQSTSSRTKSDPRAELAVQFIPAGTAFVSDVGMTADYDSIIGMNKDEPLNRFLRKLPGAKFEASNGPATLCGLAVETDDATGLARKVGAVRLGGILQEARPGFWS